MPFPCVECLHWLFIFQQAETRTLHWLSCATSKDYSFTAEQIPAPCPQKELENQPITAERALRRRCQIKESPGGKRLLYSRGRWWRGCEGSVSQGSWVPGWPSNCSWGNPWSCKAPNVDSLCEQTMICPEQPWCREGINWVSLLFLLFQAPSGHCEHCCLPLWLSEPIARQQHLPL